MSTIFLTVTGALAAGFVIEEGLSAVSMALIGFAAIFAVALAGASAVRWALERNSVDAAKMGKIVYYGGDYYFNVAATQPATRKNRRAFLDEKNRLAYSEALLDTEIDGWTPSDSPAKLLAMLLDVIEGAQHAGVPVYYSKISSLLAKRKADKITRVDVALWKALEAASLVGGVKRDDGTRAKLHFLARNWANAAIELAREERNDEDVHDLIDSTDVIVDRPATDEAAKRLISETVKAGIGDDYADAGHMVANERVQLDNAADSLSNVR